MNKDAIVSAVGDEYIEGSPVSIEGVINVLEMLGFEIVPEQPILNNDKLFEFEETIRAYNSIEEMEVGDVHGDAVIQSLQQRGWVICPPQ